MWITRCELCQRVAELALCQSCWEHIQALSEADSRCILPLTGESARHPHLSYAAYLPPLKQMLYRIKYHKAEKLAYGLGVFLGQWYLTQWPRADCVVPVPLHAQRYQQRGFNQSERLAQGFAEACACRVRLLLMRQLNTPALHGLTPEARTQVLQSAFVLSSAHREADLGRVLLIDDILTTGQTLWACAQVLQKHTPALASLSLARTLKAHV